MIDKLIIVLIVLMTLLSCNDVGYVRKDTLNTNTKEAIDWIQKHKKPIVVKGECIESTSIEPVYSYTLQSDDNNFYYTHLVYLKLPSLVEDSPSSKIYEVQIRDYEDESRKYNKKLKDILDR